MNKFLFLGFIFCTSGLLFAQHVPGYDKGADPANYTTTTQQFSVPTPSNDAVAQTQPASYGAGKYDCPEGFVLPSNADLPGKKTFFCPYKENVIVACNSFDNEVDWTGLNVDFKIVTIDRQGAPKDDWHCDFNAVPVK